MHFWHLCMVAVIGEQIRRLRFAYLFIICDGNKRFSQVELVPWSVHFKPCKDHQSYMHACMCAPCDDSLIVHDV